MEPTSEKLSTEILGEKLGFCIFSAPTRPYFRDFFPNRDFLEKVVPIQSLFQELVPIPKNRAKNYQKLTKLGPKCHFLTLKSIFSLANARFLSKYTFLLY